MFTKIYSSHEIKFKKSSSSKLRFVVVLFGFIVLLSFFVALRTWADLWLKIPQLVDDQQIPITKPLQTHFTNTLIENENNIIISTSIPFAQPPLNHLRFRKPEPVKSWEGVRDATRYSNQCIQFKPNITHTPWISDSENMDEDCLYLNIWTPLNHFAIKLKPVMVWIHGGAFFSGSASVEAYDGQTLASFGDVVVVSINYRLTAFGFLDLKNEESPGNQGLYDQQMALQWIQDNIKNFGGDPKQVTLFGQSAGAISIGLHYLSPLSRNLFTRGIMQSGSPAITRIFYERDGESSDRGPILVKMLDCWPSEDSEHIDQAINCMRMKSSEEIIKAQNKLISEIGVSFAPIVGDDFLPENPIFLMHSREFGPQKEVMIGVNKDEGSFFLHYLDPTIFNDKDNNITLQDALKFVKELFHFLPSNFVTLVFKTFLNLNEKPNPAQIRAALSNFVGDSSFVCPATIFAQLFEEFESRRCYFYQFNHRPSNSQWPEWMGVIHFDEVPFVFGAPLKYNHLYSSEEVEFSKRIMKTWVAFAKEGAPPKQLQVSWPDYTRDSLKYLKLVPNNVSIETGPRKETCLRWRFMIENSK